jgi:hypothetical protein
MKIRVPRNKYLRLLKLVLVMGMYLALCGYVFRYFWDYGFSAPHLSPEQAIARAVDALKGGLWTAVIIGFPMWLALEKFRKPKEVKEPEPAVPTHVDL